MSKIGQRELSLNEEQREGALILPGCRVALVYECETEALEERGRGHRPEQEYDLDEIHVLLSTGFEVEELLRFCSYTPEFMDLRDQLPEGGGEKSRIVRKIIEFARKKKLIYIILEWARANNLGMYESHGPYQRDVPDFRHKPADGYVV